jgi:hypothetical protein
MPVIQFEEHAVSYDDSQEVRNAVFERLMIYFNEMEAYSGECISQSDKCQENMVELLCNIADKIIKFNVKWED